MTQDDASPNAPKAKPKAEQVIWSSPRTLGRVVVAAAGVGVFFVAARTIDPTPSAAAPALPERPAEQASAPADELTSLGRFQGVEYTLHAVATPEGPRYTITDAAGGVLESLIEEGEVSGVLEAHGIDPGRPVDNAAGTLMLADDRRFDGILD